MVIRWSLAVVLLAIIAALSGFSVFALGLAGIAKLLLVVFLIVFNLAVVIHLLGLRRR